MKKRRLTKIMSLILVAGILFFTAACGASDKESAKTTTTAAEENGTEQPESPTTQTKAESSEPVRMTCFINHSWYWTDKWEGIIPEEITKKAGVALDVTRAVDDKQLGLMIASGDLPEMVFTDRELDRLSNSQLCYSYDELISQYAPDWQPNKLQIANAKSFSTDGKYYCILQNFNTQEEWENSTAVPMTCSLGYRADILRDLGNPPMNNLDEYLNILEMVKQKYPDMIPCAFSTTPGWRFTPFKV